MKLTAYSLIPNPPKIVTGSLRRNWIDSSRTRFAYRCLPLTIANQHGWDLICPVTFWAEWNGGPELRDMFLVFRDQLWDLPSSHFGEGILTFSVGYLFRTEPGINLWVGGPPNEPKDGITALTGIVETDWNPATFTMNWRFTRPGRVEFRAGESFCRIFPVPRGCCEVEPEIRPISDDPELAKAHSAWSASRAKFLTESRNPASEAAKQGWQKDYTQGAMETKLSLRDFRAG